MPSHMICKTCPSYTYPFGSSVDHDVSKRCSIKLQLHIHICVCVCVCVIMDKKLILTTFMEIYSEKMNGLNGSNNVSSFGLLYPRSWSIIYTVSDRVGFYVTVPKTVHDTTRYAVPIRPSGSTRTDWNPIRVRSAAGFLIDCGEICLSLSNKVSSFANRLRPSVYVFRGEFLYSCSEPVCCHTHHVHVQNTCAATHITSMFRQHPTKMALIYKTNSTERQKFLRGSTL